MCKYVCVCVFVFVPVRKCVCVCVRERERELNDTKMSISECEKECCTMIRDERRKRFWR
jgi:hypothetical protein